MYSNHFRDPKVIRVEDKWLMIIGGWTKVRLFSSDDLLNWTFDSEVEEYNGDILESECPDIFPLAVDGDENNVKWVITTGGTSYIVRAIFDKSVLEVFVNEGEESFHGFAFPTKGSMGMSLSVSGNATVDSLTVWEMGTMHQ